MKLFTGVLFIVCVLSGAGIYSVYLTNTDFLGYAGYCAYEPIKWGCTIYLFETWLLACFLLFLISYRNFQVSYSVVLSKFILGILTLNLGFLAYKIYEFPRVIKEAHWSFYPNPQSMNDQIVGLDYHPLIPVFLLFGLGMLWLNNISKSVFSRMFYRTINVGVAAFMFAVSVVVALSISYEMCMG
jgi:hypothetical protein